MSQSAVAAVSFRDSLHRLRSAQKSSRGAPFYSVAINRPLGRFFAACAHQVGLTPNHVTLISAVFTYTGIALVALRRPDLATAVMVTLALVVGYALDAADGQLARLRGGGSLTGEWLDHVIDSGKLATLHLAVLIGAFRFSPLPRWWLLVPVVFGAAYVVHFFGMLLTDLLIRVHSARTGTEVVQGPASKVVALLKLPTDYGMLCLTFILLAWPVAFAVAYTVQAVAIVGYTALVLPRWYARLARLQS